MADRDARRARHAPLEILRGRVAQLALSALDLERARLFGPSEVRAQRRERERRIFGPTRLRDLRLARAAIAVRLHEAIDRAAGRAVGEVVRTDRGGISLEQEIA